MDSTKFLTASLLTAGLMAVGTSASAALVAHWSFDSDFTADTGGSAFDLTAVNGATAGDAGGQFGNAATFERANSEHAFTGGNVLAANSDFSYSAWYNFGVSDITGGDRYFVLETSAADTPDNGQAWTASIGLRDLAGTDSVQIFTTTPSNDVGSTGSTASTWQNVVVTYDASSGTINAYLDGNLFATDTQGTTAAVEGLVIGGHRDGTGRNFDGQVDDVAFFDTVLTSQGIAFLQNNSASLVPEPGSLALLGLGGLMIARRRRG
ncbi:PEP-CTERM sorting domain-containing protein [Phycisphaeraceae bacterium D3-23]